MGALAWRIRLAAIALLLAGIAAAAVIVLAGGSSAADDPTATSRALATREAGALLDRVRLPAAATVTAAATGSAGDRGAGATRPLGGFAPALAVNAAQLSRTWTIAASTAAVRRFLAAHPPRGLRAGPAQTFSDTAAPDGLTDARVHVAEFAAGAHTTVVRADARVTWRVSRPASERVPEGARELEITRAIPGRAPGVHLVVTDPRRVAQIARLIDALGIVQPGAIACPLHVPGLARVTFTFRDRRGGAVLARAGEDADVRAADAACDPLDFSVDGRARTPLLGGAGLLRTVSRRLGVRLWLAPYAA